MGTRLLIGNIFKEAGLAWVQNYEEGGTCLWCGKIDGTLSLSYCNAFLLDQLLLIHWCTYSFHCSVLNVYQFPGPEGTTVNQSNLQPVLALRTVQQRMELKRRLWRMSHADVGNGQVALGVQQYLGMVLSCQRISFLRKRHVSWGPKA